MSVSLGQQTAAIAVLAKIAEAHPDLPGAFIVLSWVVPGQVSFQLAGLADLELWREALGIDPAEVEPGSCSDSQPHIVVTVVMDGVRVEVYAMGDPYATAAEEVAS